MMRRKRYEKKLVRKKIRPKAPYAIDTPVGKIELTWPQMRDITLETLALFRRINKAVMTLHLSRTIHEAKKLIKKIDFCEKCQNALMFIAMDKKGYVYRTFLSCSFCSEEIVKYKKYIDHKEVEVDESEWLDAKDEEDQEPILRPGYPRDPEPDEDLPALTIEQHHRRRPHP
jgi:hypothetical protein